MGRLIPVLLALLFVCPVHGGTLLPYLVKDLTQSQRNERVAPKGRQWAMGDVVFFQTFGVAGGLWRTDGTETGTFRIYDGRPELHKEVYAWPPAEANGFLYYPVDTVAGTFLYKTDGTTPGTSAIAQIPYATPPATSPVAQIPRWYGGAACGDGKLCFAAEGSRVGVTDGTAAGTAILMSTAPGFESSLHRSMTSMGRRAFFNAYNPQYGRCVSVHVGVAGSRTICGELWTTDGTAAGTYMVKDLHPGAGPGAPENFFVSSNGTLYFAASCLNSIEAACVWTSDGTAEGTRLLWALGSDWSAPPYFTEFGGRIYFTNSNGDAFETDGTLEGTFSLRERLQFTFPSILYPGLIVGGRMLLYVWYYDQPELWSFDGKAWGKVSDMPANTSWIGHLRSNDRIYFSSGYDHIDPPLELWSTDGTPAGTKKLFRMPRPNGTIGGTVATRSRLYYASAGGEMFTTDGTEAHKIELDVSVGGSTWALTLMPFGDRMFFDSQGKLGVTDGTPAGTVVLHESISGTPLVQDGLGYFYAGSEWWKTDGTAAGTARLRDWLGVAQVVTAVPAFIGDKTIFAAYNSSDFFLLRRDADGTIERVGPAGYFSGFTSIHGGVALWNEIRSRGAAEIMVTDGTKAGTKVVATSLVQAGTLGSAGGRAFFGARKEGSQVLTLWATDLQTAKAVKELPSNQTQNVHPVIVWRDLMIFTIGSSGGSSVLWRSDGTAEGTFPLSEQQFNAAIADGDHLTLLRYTSPGYEVWTSDGTTAGTVKRDAYDTGWKAATPFLAPGGGVAMSYTLTPLAGAGEIHIRNTRTKAVSVIDVSALEWSIGAGAGGRLYFRGYRSTTGLELWAVPLEGSAPAELPSVSIEYRGTAATVEGRAAIFRIRMRTQGAIRPVVTATTVDGSLTAEHDYVPFTREIVFENDNDVALAVPLRHADATGTMSISLSSPVNASIEHGFATAFVGNPSKRRPARH